MRYRDMHRVSDTSVRHAAEFRRCLIELDIPAIRRLWRQVSPHLPQPETDLETLQTMHTARVAMKTLPEDKRAYSEAWLNERGLLARVETGVGIMVIAPDHRREQAEYVRTAMSGSVMDSLKAGLDLDKDAKEVKRRMEIVRRRA